MKLATQIKAKGSTTPPNAQTFPAGGKTRARGVGRALRLNHVPRVWDKPDVLH